MNDNHSILEGTKVTVAGIRKIIDGSVWHAMITWKSGTVKAVRFRQRGFAIECCYNYGEGYVRFFHYDCVVIRSIKFYHCHR